MKHNSIASSNLEEKITSNIWNGLKIGIILTVYAPLLAANEIIQQVRHGYFHSRKIEHERVSDLETSFPYYQKMIAH